MIKALNPYPQYKDSGQQWLGQIPSTWSLVRTKRIYRLRTAKSSRGHGLELLSIYTHIGVRPRKDLEQKGNKASTTDGYWMVRKGDIIVNKLLAWMGAVGVSHYDGVTSPAYDILRPVHDVHSDYYHHLFRTALYLQQFKSRSRGIMEMRLRLYFDQLGQIPVLVPPRPEQSAIVRFLHHVNRRIERYIRAKKKLTALLNEQKQAIIHEAMTRGLDPNVRLKPSGIPWLGDIPKDWSILPLKRIAWFKGGCGFPVHEQGSSDPEIPFYKVSDMSIPGNETRMVTCNNSISYATAARLGATIFPEGTIIFPKVGGALLTNKRRILTRPSCIDNNQMGGVVLKADRNYIFLLLQQMDLGQLSKPGPVPAIGEGEVRELKVALPPLEEQKPLIDYIRRRTASLEGAIARTEREIALIREYRTRLVADVVTGQLDVRAAAAKLPDEPRDDDVELVEEASGEEGEPREFEDMASSGTIG